MSTITVVVDRQVAAVWKRRIIWAAIATALALGLLIAPHGASAQSTTAPAVTTAPAQTSPIVTTVRPRRRRRTTPPVPATTQESPATTADRTTQQKAADARLLARQQAASQAVKKVNDAQIQAFDANRQKVQNEPRIVDAPTLAAPPRAPVTPDPEGIHDNPNPVPPTPGQTGAIPVQTPAEEAAPPQL